jgi:uncharacterized protein with GYD domain
MATYVILGNRTPQGFQNQTIKDLPQRREARREIARTLGVTERERLFTTSEYATVEIYDAPDDETMAKYILQLSKRGNYSFRTIRAFSEAEWENVLGSLGPLAEGPTI